VACDRLVAVAAKRMMRDLLTNDVDVMDLFTAYRDKRQETQDKTPVYYYHEDAHWRNLAAQIAGEKIGERSRRYDFVQKALAGGNRYTGKVEVRRTTKNNPDTLLGVSDSKTGACPSGRARGGGFAGRDHGRQLFEVQLRPRRTSAGAGGVAHRAAAGL
jgi:hypothetical protein